MNIEEIVRIIEEEFANGHTKQIASKEMINRLKQMGFERIDVDDALDDAERHKIIDHHFGFYTWIDPSLREGEKAKTQRHFQILKEIFKEGTIDFLPEEDVKAALRGRGFDDEKIDEILKEAERDYILDFYSDTFGPDHNVIAGCSWIPPEDRERFARSDRESRKFYETRLVKKAMQDE